MLSEEFFQQDAKELARALLGKKIVRKMPNGELLSFTLSEAEAYLGEEDKASHARFGKTTRNAPMFMQGGTIYVYFVYGMHYMLNIVSGKEGDPQAVLLRGALEVEGPARLAKALHIDKSFSGKVLGEENLLWVEEGELKDRDFQIIEASRVGIGYAGDWKDKPLRFILKV